MSKRILSFTLVISIAVIVTIAINNHSEGAVMTGLAQTPLTNRTYVGSGTCGDCHMSIYERWAKTRMANVVIDPRVRPQVVLPDFSKPYPLLK